MSTTQFNLHSQPFSSTIHQNDHPTINLWTIVVTAMFFFLILSVYNLFLAIYNYVFNIRDREREDLRDDLLATFGFVFVWGITALVLYFFLDSIGYLSKSKHHESDDSEGPSLTDDSNVLRAMPEML
jgi:hypothetical protein